MSHEFTSTFGTQSIREALPAKKFKRLNLAPDKGFNVPTRGRRSGRELNQTQAIVRAADEGLLGSGFTDIKTADTAAKKRSKDFDVSDNVKFASTRPGGRVRRRHKKAGTRKALNPGGKKPRGSGGRPKT